MKRARNLARQDLSCVIAKFRWVIILQNPNLVQLLILKTEQIIIRPACVVSNRPLKRRRSPMNSYLNQNKSAWNQLADTGSQFAKVATDEQLQDPLKTLDGRGWLPDSVRGLNVLCLAAGGGWQSILYAAAGANVTVVDLSTSMLNLDRREAKRRNLQVNVVEASMDDLSMLAPGSFDIVHQPVSTCYIASIAAVYREIANVSKSGAIYISQHKQPTSLQIVRRDERDNYAIGVEYYANGPLPAATDTSYRESGTVEYLHRWDQLIGELCQAGFVIEALTEPYRGDTKAKPGHFRHRGRYTPPYVRMKARRIAEVAATSVSKLWTPD